MQQGLQQAFEQMEKENEKKRAEEVIEVQIKIMAAAYDKAIAYTNLIVVAGYASFFGLWQITKENLTQKQLIWAALLMLVSAAVFVFFEVTKMFSQSRQLQSLNRIISDPKNTYSHTALLQAFGAHNQRMRKHAIYWGYWWYFSWIITVVSAVAAVIILAWAFASALIGL